jgi:hypothetical protein
MKIKYIVVLIGIFFTSIGFAQEKTLKAIYTGYDKENNIYSFEDADANLIEFNHVKSDILKKYNLNTPEFIDQAFLITYTVKEIEDEDDSYEELTIINLKPTELVRNENPDDDDDDE